MIENYSEIQENVSQYVKVDAEKLDRLINLLGELVINRAEVEQVVNELKVQKLNEGIEQGNRIISELQDIAMKIKMVPIEILFNKTAALVKQYNEKSKQQLDLTIQGENTEIDRTIMEALEEPLCNIVDNICKKTAESTGQSRQINLAAYTEGSNAIVKVNGDLSERYLEDESKRIAAIGGNLDVSENGIIITVPLNLSIIKALLVQIGNHNFALPLDVIDTIINRNSFEIRTSNGREVIVYRNNVIPLIRISDKLNIAKEDCKDGFAIIAMVQGKTIVLLVDFLLGQKDIVVKPIADIFKNQREFSGATILGDGMVTLIIDVAGLI